MSYTRQPAALVEADFATTYALENWAVAKFAAETEVEVLDLHYDHDAGHPAVIRARRVFVKYYAALDRYEKAVGKRIDVTIGADASLPSVDRIDAWLDRRYLGRPCARAVTRTVPRSRAPRRPARRRTSSSSTTSGTDPGDSDSDPPSPAPAGRPLAPRGAAHRVALSWLLVGAWLVEREEARR
ncbi:MAG: hypothetical protein WKF96_11560 [Solirubrobacteraceae bacterium]